MSKQITAILFDFDGTLMDTNELIVQTFEHVLGRHYPGKYERTDIYAFIGPTLEETFESINPEKSSQLIQEYRAWNEEMHDGLVHEFEGVSKTLKLLKEKGLKIAIVSTKQTAMVKRGVKLLDVDETLFDAIIGLDQVTHAKPNPESLLFALDKLGVSKEEALMVGDNYHDILGGQNAGVRTVGVAWALKGEAYLQTFNPDFMLHHISDILAIVEEESV
ncbi:pyrophosphatase PpaX [Sporosarcina sp. CAU 1771]